MEKHKGKFVIRKKGEARAKWTEEPKVDVPVQKGDLVHIPGLDIFGRP